MSDLRISEEAGVESVETETERIMRTGTTWLGAIMITAGLLLGPAVASGWRPTLLPGPLEALWWLGTLGASLGVALLVWAGCPVLGFALPDAHRQKVFSIRVGIALSVGGIALAGLAVLLSPVS